MKTETVEHNPYLAVRVAWQERYGSLIDRIRNATLIAVLALICCALSTSLAIYGALRSPVVTIPVLIDKDGRTIGGGVTPRLSQDEADVVKRATMQTLVTELRTVTTDGVAQRAYIDKVYARISQGSAAQAIVNDFYRATPPFDRAKTETVAVQVNSVLPTSDKTFEVDWQETVRDLFGEVKNEDRWRGSFTVAFSPPRNEHSALMNPLGMYLTNISTTKVQGEK